MTSSGGDPETQRLQVVVAYDGTDFHGFAYQREVRTVEGTLSEALAKVLQTTPAALGIVCAGRTDAGVHARGQVVSVDAPTGADLVKARRSLNRMLGPEVVVRAIRVAEPGFDARHSATARTYRYTIFNGEEPDPFLSRHAWWVPVRLDVARLRLASDPFIGEHDFAAFCRRGAEGTTTRRRVMSSRWLTDDRPGVLVYEVVANAFCWQMVRSIVGTLVEAGAGRRRPGDILRTLRTGDRAEAGAVAPPHGLCLWRVDYED